MFGLLFTYILGALIISMSFALDPIMRYMHRRRKYKQYQYLEWRTNGALQLHRLAQDELGYGKWSGCTDTVPVTRPGDALADLNISDLEYPKLRRGLSVEEEVKPETINHTEAGDSEQTSAEASKHTLYDTEAKPVLSEPQPPSEVESESGSPLEEHQSLEVYRVSVLSEEGYGAAQTNSHGIVAENAQESNISR